MSDQKPIAIAVYMTDNNDLYTKKLYTQEEVEAVRNSEDEDTREYKTQLVLADLTTEDYT